MIYQTLIVDYSRNANLEVEGGKILVDGVNMNSVFSLSSRRLLKMIYVSVAAHVCMLANKLEMTI